jgi:hypothetical protein
MAIKYSSFVRPIRDRFQRKRAEWFVRVVSWQSIRSVVDVGGTPEFWKRLDNGKLVTLVNNDPGELKGAEGFIALVGDGRALDLPPASFDLAFSNSVIEHVGEYRDMEAFAAELRRVGRSYWCQTPNKWFPVETHLGTLFFHWWPPLLRIYPVVRYMTLWGLMNKPSREAASNAVANINLIGRRRIEILFPDARILTERWMGLPKSFIAVRLAEKANPVQSRPA